MQGAGAGRGLAHCIAGGPIFHFFCFVDTHIDEHCLLARSGTLLYGRDSFEAEQAGANLVVSLCQVLFANVLAKLAQ